MRRRALFTSSSSLNGFVMYISAPLRNPHDLSNAVFLFVNKIIGICLLASRLFNLRQIWKPFCLGKTTSRTMHCGRSRNTFSIASSPSTAVTTSKPLFRKGVAIIVNSVQLSSTTRTFCPGISVYLSFETMQTIAPGQWERWAISMQEVIMLTLLPDADHLHLPTSAQASSHPHSLVAWRHTLLPANKVLLHGLDQFG